MNEQLNGIASNSCQEKIKKYWESFHREGKMPVNNEIRSTIKESWLRCRTNGIRPLDEIEFGPDFVLNAQKKYAIMYELYKEVGHDLVSHLHELISDQDSFVGYVTDENLIIVKTYGRDTTPLKMELEGKNVRLGTDLKESIVGTNAVALAKKTGEKVWVIGAEHYKEIFHDYACTAIAYRDSHGEIFSIFMLVTRINLFNALGLGWIDYLNKYLEKNFILQEKNVHLALMNEFANLGMEQYSKIAISFDWEGKVISINKQTQKVLGIKPEQICGKHFYEVIQGLDYFKEHLSVAKPVLNHEVFQIPTVKGNQNFLANYHSVQKNNKPLGGVLTLEESKSVHKFINRISHSYASLTFDNLIGENRKFLKTKEIGYKASQVSSNVLLLGESGTGKELFAQGIHNASKRAEGPFIPVNCAAIPRELIGSELFGYVEGAFTGAVKGGAPGKFELANEGTIFLDEIGEMPLQMQAALLRVLEEKKVTRLGGKYYTPVDVRIISATNRDLKNEVARHNFRADLYYRLNVIALELLPLRERRDDIALLTNYFLKQYGSSLNKNVNGVTDEVLDILIDYPWPGNIRELNNVIERGVILTTSEYLQKEDLPQDIIDYRFSANPNMKEELDNYEYQRIIQLLKEFNGNKAKVAQKMGISRTTLYRKLNKNN